jgi:hypothetical protein
MQFLFWFLLVSIVLFFVTSFTNLVVRITLGYAYARASISYDMTETPCFYEAAHVVGAYIYALQGMLSIVERLAKGLDFSIELELLSLVGVGLRRYHSEVVAVTE